MSGRGERCEEIWPDFLDPEMKGLAADGFTPHRLQLPIMVAAYRQTTVSSNAMLVDGDKIFKA
jgi:hypothetical protein